MTSNHVTYLRKAAIVSVDMAIVALAYYFSYWLRLDALSGGFTGQQMTTLIATLPWLLGIRFICGFLVRQHNWSFRHASLAEACNLIIGLIAGSILFFALTHYGQIVGNIKPPRSVYVLEFAMSMIGMVGVRFGPRYVYQLFVRRGSRLTPNGESKLRTLIFGAGYSGELILRNLLQNKIYPYSVIGFVDDDPVKWNTSIHGCRVLGASQDLPELISKHRIDKLLIAAKSISSSKLRDIVELCSTHHVKLKMIPSYADLVAKGAAGPISLKDVQLEDLLERDPINFDHTKMAEFFLNRTVLVTGAAGSIGSEICRQVVAQGAMKIVCVDLNENDLYFLNMELRDISNNTEIVIMIASVRDRKRLDHVFAAHKPDIVFHAAAHKHVPLMEDSPAEALKNNVLGTLNAAECASKYHADRFVLISTDKAVRPTNVMGASKRLAEFVIGDLNNKSETRFMAVRFGNVLGSNGSLVPILARQISKGGPITITHPKITRYFMTIPEAVGLVLVAAVQDEGAVCVLDMGEPLNIDQLARAMISLSGLIPDQDIKIVYTGLRPGEKMYEELFTHDETLSESSHPKIRVAHSADRCSDVESILGKMNDVIESGEDNAVRTFLKEFVPGYTSDFGT